STASSSPWRPPIPTAPRGSTEHGRPADEVVGQVSRCQAGRDGNRCDRRWEADRKLRYAVACDSGCERGATRAPRSAPTILRLWPGGATFSTDHGRCLTDRSARTRLDDDDVEGPGEGRSPRPGRADRPAGRDRGRADASLR